MNWSIIILGLITLSAIAVAENSYLIVAPKLLKVNYDNQLSVFISAASQPVELKFELILAQQHVESKTTCKSGETRNATLTLPKDFPTGAGELIITATGGLHFEEKREVIVYDNRRVLLVQTSASTYRPRDTMEIRIVATDENLIPIEQGELMVEIYDSSLKLVGNFPRIPIRSGLTETIRFPIANHVSTGKWLVTAIMENTTSSVEVFVSKPMISSFDLKAIFQRYLLRTDKALRGVIEISNDQNEAVFGRGAIHIGQITEQEMVSKPKTKPEEDEWRQWKSQSIEIAGRVELNYDLLSLFNIDVTKVLAIQVHIQVIDLISGNERIIHHIIPVFTNDVIYDIRPLEFQAGIINEFEIIAKRPDGKPTKMEDMIVTVRMIMGDEQGKQKEEKSVEVKEFYTRGRNDIGLFNLEIPEKCIGVLMTITPLGEDGKVRGYRTHALPLLPKPQRHGANGAKLSIELLPSTAAPGHTDVNVPVISSQISTVGRTSNFYVQIIPSKPVQKFERLPMSYVLMTNGRITLTGEFFIEPTKQCQTKTARTIQPEGQKPPTCVFNGTLPIQITRDMMPYSTLLVYTFQSSFDFHVAEAYRFAVAGLFQSSLTLNATLVPFTPIETMVNNQYLMQEMNIAPIRVSNKVQDKTRIELSFNGAADSIVGLNVFEADGVLQGLSDDMTKERLLKYLTTYEHVPINGMPMVPQSGDRKDMKFNKRSGDWNGANEPMQKRSGDWNGADEPMQKRHVDWNGADEPMQKRHVDWNGADEPMQKRHVDWNGAQGPMQKRNVDWNGPGMENNKRNVDWNGPGMENNKRNVDWNGPGMENNKRNVDWHGPGMENNKRNVDWHGPGMENNKRNVDWNGPGMENNKRNVDWHGPGMENNKRNVDWNGPGMENNKRNVDWNGPGMENNKRSIDWNQPESTHSRRSISENDEIQLINQAQMYDHIHHAIGKTIFNVESSHSLPLVEGDDIYRASNMERLYADDQSQPSSSHYRRKYQNSMNQYGVAVGDNDFIVATSVPLMLAAASSSKPMSMKPEQQQNGNTEMNPQEESSQYGSPSWYENMNSKLNAISQEAFIFMRSGLSIISDFDSLRIPTEMRRENLTKLFNRFQDQSKTMLNQAPFSLRDEARQVLGEFMQQSAITMVPSPILFDEQARTVYYRSVFFNTSRIESQGTGKVVLPQIKPYSTWVATGFALNAKSGLAIARPIRLPTNQGLYVLGNCPQQVRVGERALLTYGINNYLGKDLSNVILRIRASADFELFEESNLERAVSSKDKDYTVTIPTFKSLAVETRSMVMVPKRNGVLQIIIEVESEFGGDYEVLTVFVSESGIQRKQVSLRLFDLTNGTKPAPMVEKISDSPALRSVLLSVSGTDLDRLAERYTMETSVLVGIDRALVRLYRSLGLRRYLNETSQTESPLFNMTTDNVTTAYQTLQIYGDNDGSYSFMSDENVQHSSLYLTTLAFGAMISPMMPFRDNVTLNRTLNWILSRQQEDGSFDDNSPCFHYRFCAGEFRRESLTALVLYSLTHDNASDFMPEFIRYRLHNGENNPVYRAQRYLESRVPDIKPHLLTITLFEMAFMQNRTLSPVLRGKIHDTLLSRTLAVVPEDGSKHLQNIDGMSDIDELLVNSMTISLYLNFDDYRTASDISRWVVKQVSNHPHYDSILDAVFQTDAWIKVDAAFRRQFAADKIAVTIDVSADNGQKQQFKINSKNMDLTQTLHFTLPVRQVTYSVSGFGVVCVRVLQTFIEQQQQPITESAAFQVSQEFSPMPWFSEILAKTCMTYTPTAQDQQLAKDNFNRTMVMEVQLPSGTRIHLHQLGLFLSRAENVMYFTYEPCGNKLTFFINVPVALRGQPICLEWCLERLSSIATWTPIHVRVYDYLRPGNQLVKLIPFQPQPNVLGFSFIDAVHKARPSLESIFETSKPKQV